MKENMESIKNSIIVVALALGLFNIIYACSIDEQKSRNIEKIEHLESRIEVLKERCDDFQYTVNRVNALEATTQHQQEVLDTIDWAVRYRY